MNRRPESGLAIPTGWQQKPEEELPSIYTWFCAYFILGKCYGEKAAQATEISGYNGAKSM